MSEPAVPASGLATVGWTDQLGAHFAPLAREGVVPGRVSRVDRGRCEVLIERDGDRADDDLVVVHAGAEALLGLDPVLGPCAGDWVAVDLHGPTGPAMTVMLPRSSVVVRAAAGTRSAAQPLAANVDAVLIATALAGKPDLGRLERFLTLAWESGAAPIVVLTKADLAEDPEHRELIESAALGADVFEVSAVNGVGLDELRARLPFTSALLGVSGAGKSTLVNALAGREVAAVQEVRGDLKGRHTTVTRELIRIPGGVIIDTPGLRGVGLAGGDGLEQTFADIEELAEQCRFADCGHDSEPGCAVQAAIVDGALPRRRLESYRKLLRENEWMAARTDKRLASERDKRWAKMIRAANPSRP